MSYSAPDKRAFFNTVQDYFLERTGKGLVLSSRDLELLLNWRNHGASAAAVCQGIDEAVTSLNRAPRDLHACKAYVEPKLSSGVGPVRRAPERRRANKPSPTVEAAEDPIWSGALEKLDAGEAKAERPELRSVYARARGRIRESQAASRDPYGALFELDDWMVDTLFDGLGEDERRMIDLEIEGKHGAHLSMMDDGSREQTMRASRRKALAARFGLISVVDG